MYVHWRHNLQGIYQAGKFLLCKSVCSKANNLSTFFWKWQEAYLTPGDGPIKCKVSDPKNIPGELCNETAVSGSNWVLSETFKNRQKSDTQSSKTKRLKDMSYKQLKKGLLTWCFRKSYLEVTVPGSTYKEYQGHPNLRELLILDMFENSWRLSVLKLITQTLWFPSEVIINSVIKYKKLQWK